MTTMMRPAPGEAPPYHQAYIDTLGDEDVLEVLASQVEETAALLQGPLAERGDYAYGPEKWTVKEVLQHVIDGERIFAYRALRMARGDSTPLPGFEQNGYAAESRAGDRTLEEMVAEFRAVRAATVALFRSFAPDVLTRTGTAGGNAYTVRAWGAICAGHERHHLVVLRERYL